MIPLLYLTYPRRNIAIPMIATYDIAGICSFSAKLITSNICPTIMTRFPIMHNFQEPNRCRMYDYIKIYSLRDLIYHVIHYVIFLNKISCNYLHSYGIYFCIICICFVLYFSKNLGLIGISD